jgi:hypothetical protein
MASQTHCDPFEGQLKVVRWIISLYSEYVTHITAVYHPHPNPLPLAGEGIGTLMRRPTQRNIRVTNPNPLPLAGEGGVRVGRRVDKLYIS